MIFKSAKQRSHLHASFMFIELKLTKLHIKEHKYLKQMSYILKAKVVILA